MARLSWAAHIRPLRMMIVLSLGILSMIALAAPPARAAAPVEAFVQQNVDKGIAILKDKTLTEADRRKEVRALLTTVVDAKKVALFALGETRDKASKTDLDAYVDAFTAFVTANYESQLDGYGGQSLKVTGSVARAPGDEIVTAVLIDPANPSDSSDLVVFRVLDENGKFAVVDASIEGVWLGLAQRADFQGFLSQHGGSLPALTAHLRDITTQLEAPKTAVPTP